MAGGFAAWVVIQAVSYYVARRRLKTYLVVQVNTRLQNARRNCQWLEQLGADHSSAGVTPMVAPRYSPDHAEDLHESRELVLKYLFRGEIERLTKFLLYLWEVEYLTEGICEAMGAYAKRATPLTADECQILTDRVSRVTSIVEKWKLDIKSLKDLPIDYAGVQGPGAVKVLPE